MAGWKGWAGLNRRRYYHDDDVLDFLIRQSAPPLLLFEKKKRDTQGVRFYYLIRIAGSDSLCTAGWYCYVAGSLKRVQLTGENEKIKWTDGIDG